MIGKKWRTDSNSVKTRDRSTDKEWKWRRHQRPSDVSFLYLSRGTVAHAVQLVKRKITEMKMEWLGHVPRGDVVQVERREVELSSRMRKDRCLF